MRDRFVKFIDEATGDLTSAVEHSATSALHYNQFLAELKKVIPGEKLETRKERAKRAAEKHIPHLTSTHAAQLFQDLHQVAELAFIREEHGFHKIFGAYGNTTTYKHITDLLKKRANENFQRHTDSPTRSPQDNSQEMQDLFPLMTARRGRFPNLFAKLDLPVGETGKFLAECEKRGGLRR